MREFDCVLDDVSLFLQLRMQVDCRVGDDQGSRTAGSIHDKCVADPPLQAQTGTCGNNRLEELIRWKTSLHKDSASTHTAEKDSSFCCFRIVGHIYNWIGSDVDALFTRQRLDPCTGSNKIGRCQSRTCSIDGASERDFAQR